MATTTLIMATITPARSSLAGDGSSDAAPQRAPLSRDGGKGRGCVDLFGKDADVSIQQFLVRVVGSGQVPRCSLFPALKGKTRNTTVVHETGGISRAHTGGTLPLLLSHS